MAALESDLAGVPMLRLFAVCLRVSSLASLNLQFPTYKSINWG